MIMGGGIFLRTLFIETLPYLRDNPRYMAGEFLSVALQNIEDFKFEEVRFYNVKMILSCTIHRHLIILKKLPTKQ